MALKLKVERMVCQDSVHWVARLLVDGKHVGTMDFDEIELEGDIVALEEEDDEG